MNLLRQIVRILLLPFVIVGRLIFWLLFAIAALLLIKRLKRHVAPPTDAPSSRPTGARAVEDMVACAKCGLLLPESESVRSGNEHYCCEEHRRSR